MPYQWIAQTSSQTDHAELHLWPHQSLTAEGYAGVIGVTAGLLLVPLLPVLGSVVLWGLLPFLLVALFGLKWALDYNRKQSQILEVLKLDGDSISLTRYGPAGRQQTWDCNRYWAKVSLHQTDGPVPHYVTLTGGGREVEIGAFLSETEREELYLELHDLLTAR